MSKRKDKGQPQTGDGYKARGRKPKTGELTMMTGNGRVAHKQPRGWHILNVLPFGRKHKP